MPVVINEFEVVDTEPLAQERRAPETRTPPPLPDPEDLRRLLAQQAESALRLWAH